MALGFIRIGVLFVFQTMFARRGIPKILDDFVIAMGLVVYAIFRLNALGVNLAGLITTSAVITGALAFSAKETLGNLWGGIALQVEKTCRIGDWVRIDAAIGQVVSIRWRYMAIATTANETMVIPNANVMKDRITVIARRGEDRIPWIRYLPFELEFDHSPEQVIGRLDKAFADAEIPNVGRDAAAARRVHRLPRERHRIPGAVRAARSRRCTCAPTRRCASTCSPPWRGGNSASPIPRRVIETRPDTRPEEAQREHVARLAALRGSDLFASLTDDEHRRRRRSSRACLYAGGDVIFRAGRDGRLAVPADATARCAWWATTAAIATSSRGSPRRRISARWACCSASRASRRSSPSESRAIGSTGTASTPCCRRGRSSPRRSPPCSRNARPRTTRR